MEFSWSTIVWVLGGCLLFIKGIVPALKLITDRVDARKKEKQEKLDTEEKKRLDAVESDRKNREIHESQSAQLSKIEFDERALAREELRKQVEDYKSQCEDCKKKLELLELTSPEGRAKKRQFNALMLKINKNIYSMDKGFEEKYHVIELGAIFDHIKKLFIELEDLMS